MSSLRSPLAPAPDDPPARTQLSSWYTQGPSDGFGDRLLMFDNASTGPLELLRVRADFALVPEFEARLRTRFEQVASFTHPGFAQPRAVNHLDNGEGLTVVSAHVPGTRLSDLFPTSRPHAGIHPALARWALGELTSAIAALHRHAPGVAHGALAPDRVVITADRHMVIADWIFGDALARMDLPAERLWTEFGIVSPIPHQKMRLDQRSDVVQLALIVLSLVLGRRVTPDEYPQQLNRLLEECGVACERQMAGSSSGIRTWIERALRPDGFASGMEAEVALFYLLGPVGLGDQAGTPAMPPNAGVAATTTPSDDPVAVVDAPVAASGLTPAVPVAAVSAPAAAATPSATSPVAVATPLAPTPPGGGRLLTAAVDPLPANDRADTDARPRARVFQLVLAALALIGIVQGAVIARLVFRGPAVVASPAAAAVSPGDGEPQASAPAARVDGTDTPPAAAAPAPAAPTHPGAVVASSQSAPAEAPKPAESKPVDARSRTGGVRVVSPVPVQIVEGEQILGSSANGPIFASPGTHEIDLINNALGFRSHQTVRLVAGRVIPLEITPPDGRISINAQPWAQVSIDGKPAGETPLANLTVPIGEHEVVFRHPQLGERRQKVVVQAGTLTRVSASFAE